MENKRRGTLIRSREGRGVIILSERYAYLIGEGTLVRYGGRNGSLFKREEGTRWCTFLTGERKRNTYLYWELEGRGAFIQSNKGVNLFDRGMNAYCVFGLLHTETNKYCKHTILLFMELQVSLNKIGLHLFTLEKTYKHN